MINKEILKGKYTTFISPVFRALTPKNQEIELYLHTEASNVAQARAEAPKVPARLSP